MLKHILLQMPCLLDGELGILKSEVRFRSAWEIGENDPDIVAIQEGDNPIIPEGIDNAPVLTALTRFQKRRATKR